MIMRFYQKSLQKLFLKNAGIHISFFFFSNTSNFACAESSSFQTEHPLAIIILCGKENVYDETQFNQELYIHTAGPH